MATPPIALLKRWIAATGGDQPYPTTANQLTPEVALQLSGTDPELYSVINGTASARIQLQIAEGSFPDAIPSPAEQAELNRQARIEELVASNPYGKQGYYAGDAFIPAVPGNLTAALELEALAPEQAAALKLAATPLQQPQGMTQAQADWVNAEMQRNRNAGQQQQSIPVVIS